jgi:hypothetical protein
LMSLLKSDILTLSDRLKTVLPISAGEMVIGAPLLGFQKRGTGTGQQLQYTTIFIFSSLIDIDKWLILYHRYSKS